MGLINQAWPCPKRISKTTTNATFKSMRRVNWRIVEAVTRSRHYVWCIRSQSVLWPFAMLQANGRLVINLPNFPSPTSGLLERVTPLYKWKYGGKYRFGRFSRWELVTNPKLWTARGWKTLKNTSLGSNWPTGNFVGTGTNIVVFKPDFIPFYGVKPYEKRSRYSTKPRPKPKYVLSWQELIAEFPLLNAIGHMLQDDTLRSVTSKGPYSVFTVPQLHRFRIDWLVNAFYPHILISHPKATKRSLYEAIRQLKEVTRFPTADTRHIIDPIITLIEKRTICTTNEN